MNGTASAFRFLSTSAISVIIAFLVNREIGVENVVPYILSHIGIETFDTARNTSVPRTISQIPEPVNPDTEDFSFDEVILLDDMTGIEGSSAASNTDFYFSTGSDNHPELTEMIFAGTPAAEIRIELLGELKAISENNEYWNRCRLMYENVVAVSRTRAQIIPQLETAEYSGVLDVSHPFVTRMPLNISEVTTHARMAASGRVVAPVGVSGIQVARSKNHATVTFHLIEPTSTHVYIDQVLSFSYDNNILLSARNRLDNASCGYGECLDLFKEMLAEEALAEGLLETTRQNTEEYISELEAIHAGDLTIFARVVWHPEGYQLSAEEAAMVTDCRVLPENEGAVRFEMDQESYGCEIGKRGAENG